MVTKLTEELKSYHLPTTSADDVWYHVGVVCNKGSCIICLANDTGVPAFHPCVPNPPILKKENLREWLLTKCINGERMALEEASAFSKRIAYTRQQMLQELVTTCAMTKQKKKKLVVSL